MAFAGPFFRTSQCERKENSSERMAIFVGRVLVCVQGWLSAWDAGVSGAAASCLQCEPGKSTHSPAGTYCWTWVNIITAFKERRGQETKIPTHHVNRMSTEWQPRRCLCSVQGTIDKRPLGAFIVAWGSSLPAVVVAGFFPAALSVL